MDKNFFNVASNFWGNKLISCSSCSKRESIPNSNENDKFYLKQKTDITEEESNETPVESSNKNSKISGDFSFFDDITSNSLPIKFSGTPKGKPWSSEEDDLLKDAVKFFNGKNWKMIASQVPGRSSTQCSQRWRRIQPYKNRFPWTIEEDNHLLELVASYGPNWSIIASSLPGRTGKQVRERYLNHLDPYLNRNKFTQEEDEIIIELYTKLGPKWKEISKQFFGRTENMVKNRFYSHIKKKLLLKYPHKYKKTIEKAQTEVSIKNFSSPIELFNTPAQKEVIKIEEFSEHDIGKRGNHNEFENPFQSKIDSFNNFTELKQENIKGNALFPSQSAFQNKMELENNNDKVDDGFLNLYRNSSINENMIQNTRRNEPRAFSPIIEKNLPNFHENSLKNQENPYTNLNNTYNNYYQLINKCEEEIKENKARIFNMMFNSKGNEQNNPPLLNEGIDNPIKPLEDPINDKILSRINHLQEKKANLETMIKSILGKIDKSNSQNLL